jgi:hypothetical protein
MSGAYTLRDLPTPLYYAGQRGVRQGQVSAQAVCRFLSIFTRGGCSGTVRIFTHLYARQASSR